MKYIVGMTLFLIGCDYNWSGAAYNDTVRVKSGFYKDCYGVAEEKAFTWVMPCDNFIWVNFGLGNCRSAKRQIISTCDLKVIK